MTNDGGLQQTKPSFYAKLAKSLRPRATAVHIQKADGAELLQPSVRRPTTAPSVLTSSLQRPATRQPKSSTGSSSSGSRLAAHIAQIISPSGVDLVGREERKGARVPSPSRPLVRGSDPPPPKRPATASPLIATRSVGALGQSHGPRSRPSLAPGPPALRPATADTDWRDWSATQRTHLLGR